MIEHLEVEKQWIRRAVTVKSNANGDLTEHDAEQFAISQVSCDWELIDTERLNYDRIIVYFEGPTL